MAETDINLALKMYTNPIRTPIKRWMPVPPRCLRLATLTPMSVMM